MWAGLFVPLSGHGRSPTAEPDCVDALTYRQGPAGGPEGRRRCVVLVFEEQIGSLFGATHAEIRMEIGTARALRDKLDSLLTRIANDELTPEDDIDGAS